MTPEAFPSPLSAPVTLAVTINLPASGTPVASSSMVHLEARITLTFSTHGLRKKKNGSLTA